MVASHPAAPRNVWLRRPRCCVAVLCVLRVRTAAATAYVTAGKNQIENETKTRLLTGYTRVEKVSAVGGTLRPISLRTHAYIALRPRESSTSPPLRAAEPLPAQSPSTAMLRTILITLVACAQAKKKEPPKTVALVSFA